MDSTALLASVAELRVECGAPLFVQSVAFHRSELCVGKMLVKTADNQRGHEMAHSETSYVAGMSRKTCSLRPKTFQCLRKRRRIENNRCLAAYRAHGCQETRYL